MTQRRIRTAKPSEARNAHSAGIVAHGSFLFTSGITPRDDDGALVGAGDMTAQVRSVFENLGDVLAEAGCRWADVIKLTIYVTDIDRYRAARGDLTNAFEEIMAGEPASTLVEVSRLADPEMMVEVEAVALVGDGISRGP